MSNTEHPSSTDKAREALAQNLAEQARKAGGDPVEIWIDKADLQLVLASLAGSNGLNAEEHYYLAAIVSDEEIDELASEHNVYDKIDGAVLCDIKDIRNLVRAVRASATLATPPAPRAPSIEPVAWVDARNLASAEIARERGGPFDSHVWSEGKTAIHDTPLYASLAAPASAGVEEFPLPEPDVTSHQQDSAMETYTIKSYSRRAVREILRSYSASLGHQATEGKK